MTLLRCRCMPKRIKGRWSLLSRKISRSTSRFVSHAGQGFDERSCIQLRIGIKREPLFSMSNSWTSSKTSWKDEWGGDGLSSHQKITFQSEHLIPNEICQKVKNLVDDHKKGRLRAKEIDSSFFTTFLDYPDMKKVFRRTYLKNGEKRKTLV